MLGKAPWTSRNSADATLPECQASLTLCATTCMASVVQRPGQPPNCIEGSILCFSARWERSAATSMDRSLPNVSNRPMGWYDFATL